MLLDKPPTWGAAPTVYTGRPRFEGSNICTWIGFKHVMYLIEEAVLDHFRSRGLAPGRLFEEHGVGLEIVDSRARILTALHMDDEVRVEVSPARSSAEDEVALQVQILVERPEGTVKALTGKVNVLFRRADAAAPAELPAEIVPFVHPAIERGPSSAQTTPVLIERGRTGHHDDVSELLAPSGTNAVVWKWRIPYFYCHFTERIQHSGYLRLMEEIVDLFLAERGISISTMLATRAWIPVVPEARLEILREALMEETLYTVYAVEDIFKDLTYAARMDCYVVRAGKLVHTATGRIVHGYARIINGRDWALVPFDAPTLAALRNWSAP